jgi:protein O-mannosyl-transferase
VARPPGKFACVLQSPLLVAIVIAAVTLAVFIHVLSADFVMWDDDVIIYRNPAIRSLNLDKIFTDVDSMMRYNPLTLLGWSVTYHFFKLNPFWYHLVNWLLHGLNASLVFLVLRKLLVSASSNRNRLSVNPWRITISAGLAALLWSVHPMRVEPVAWCTDRTYCQSLLFLLLSLLFYLRANEPETDIGRHYMLLTVSVVLYIVSLLSYAIGMTFFLVLLVLDIYPLRKFDAGSGWWKSSTNRRTLLEKIPFAAAALSIAMVTVCIRMASAGVWKKPVPLANFGLIERFMQAMYIWAYYIWRPWYPVNLSPVYTTLVSFNPLSPVFINSAILVIGIVTLMILLRRRWPLGLALVICYLLLLVPVLGVLEHPHYPCDRYSIIVSILWSILMAAWLAHPKTKTLPFRISLVLSIIVIATFGLLTFRQTHVWTNSKTLFAHTIKTLNDDTYRSEIYWRLGNVYQLEGNTEEAIRQYKNAVRISPDFLLAQKDICLTLLKQNKLDEAIACFNEVLRQKKDTAEVHCNLATALIMQKKYDDAIKHLAKALELDLNYPNVHYKMGTTLLAAGRLQEAVAFLNEALKTNASQAEVYVKLGTAYTQLGEYGPATQNFRKTLGLDPNNVDALNNLAWLLATRAEVSAEDANKAIGFAEDACKLTEYKEPTLLDTLAVAYAAVGRFDDAVNKASQAIEIAKANGQKDLALEIQNRLDLYRTGRPYREK